MKIIIQGIPREGKTTIARIIWEALAKENIKARNDDPDAFQTKAPEVQVAAMQSLRLKDDVITIEVQQTPAPRDPRRILDGLSGCSCLWDLDQLIGEEGCDEVFMTVTLKNDETFRCQGKDLTRELRNRWGEDDPDDIIKSIQA